MNQDAWINLMELSQNPYPGRGIVLGVDETGRYIVQVYWIMGRSENSRNRVFGYDPKGGQVFTEAADPTEMKDPSLVIYNAMMENEQMYVVSNGRQTSDLANRLFISDFHPILVEKWGYEPDAPNYTPRISAAFCHSGEFHFQMSIIRRCGWGLSSHHLYRFSDIDKGVGYCITTYSGDGDPLPAFTGEPYPLPLKGSIKEIALTIWDALNDANRVALAVKFIDRSSGKSTVRIINKYAKVR